MVRRHAASNPRRPDRRVLTRTASEYSSAFDSLARPEALPGIVSDQAPIFVIGRACRLPDERWREPRDRSNDIRFSARGIGPPPLRPLGWSEVPTPGAATNPGERGNAIRLQSEPTRGDPASEVSRVGFHWPLALESPRDTLEGSCDTAPSSRILCIPLAYRKARPERAKRYYAAFRP